MAGVESKSYRAREFADLAGVTVRALHHYDRLGLLKPRRTDAGYRLYRGGDLERLEQIVALKFLGLTLRQIQAVLERDGLALPEALGRQRRVLEEKRRLLDNAIAAIREAEAAVRPGKRPDPAMLSKIIEAIDMQNNPDWMLKYYSDEAKAKIQERRKLWSPELQAKVSQEWSELFREVEAALGDDPAGGKAQDLAARWMRLVEGFTGGDPQITAGLKALYADQANWPKAFREQMAQMPHVSQPALWEFIQKALAARK